MNPQGAGLINTAYYEGLIAQVQAIENCDALNQAVTTIFASIQAEKTAIEQQIARYQPLLALLTPPTTPNAVVGWVSNFISLYLTPQIQPFYTYTTQLATLVTTIEHLVSEIEAAAGRIPTCQVVVPSLS